MSGPVGVSHKSLPSGTNGQFLYYNVNQWEGHALLAADIPTLTLAKISDAGTMAAQNASAVAITGGTINGTTLGATTPASGAFTTLDSSGNAVFGAAGANTARLNVNAAASGKGLIVRNNATTPGNATEWQDATGSPIATMDNGGNLLVQRFRSNVYQNSAGNTYLQISGSLPNQVIDFGNVSNLQTFNLFTKPAGVMVLQSGGGSVGIGVTAPASILHAVKSDAGTNDTQTVLTIGRNSSGTPAANFASRLLWQLESSTTENRDAAAIDVVWTTATDASRQAKLVFSTFTAGVQKTAMTIENGVVAIAPTLTNPSGASVSTNNRLTLIQTGSANTTYQIGFQGEIWVDATNNQNWTSAIGLIGVRGRVETRSGSTGTISNVRAFTSQIERAAASMTNVYHYYVENPTGSVGTQYGLYIEALTAGGTNYAIYTNAGTVRIGGVLQHDGSTIGFLGATAVARQALGAWAGLTTDQKLDALRDALTNLGLTSYT